MHTPLHNLPFSKLPLSFSPTTPRLPDHQRDHVSNFRGRHVVLGRTREPRTKCPGGGGGGETAGPGGSSDAVRAGIFQGVKFS